MLLMSFAVAGLGYGGYRIMTRGQRIAGQGQQALRHHRQRLSDGVGQSHTLQVMEVCELFKQIRKISRLQGSRRQGGHDQHGVPDDRGIEADLGLVQPEAALCRTRCSPRLASPAQQRGSAGTATPLALEP